MPLLVIEPCKLVVLPCKVPDEIVVPPEYVLVPVKTMVPIPVNVKPPIPESAPESVAEPEIGLWTTPPALVMAIDTLEASPLFSTKVPPARMGFAVTPMVLKPTLAPATMLDGVGESLLPLPPPLFVTSVASTTVPIVPLPELVTYNDCASAP